MQQTHDWSSLPPDLLYRIASLVPNSIPVVARTCSGWHRSIKLQLSYLGPNCLGRPAMGAPFPFVRSVHAPLRREFAPAGAAASCVAPIRSPELLPQLFPSLTHLDVAGQDLGQEGLGVLGPLLGRMQHLDLSGCALSVADVQTLGGMTRLQWLSLNGVRPLGWPDAAAASAVVMALRLSARDTPAGEQQQHLHVHQQQQLAALSPLTSALAAALPLLQELRYLDLGMEDAPRGGPMPLPRVHAPAAAAPPPHLNPAHAAAAPDADMLEVAMAGNNQAPPPDALRRFAGTSPVRPRGIMLLCHVSCLAALPHLSTLLLRNSPLSTEDVREHLAACTGLTQLAMLWTPRPGLPPPLRMACEGLNAAVWTKLVGALTRLVSLDVDFAGWDVRERLSVAPSRGLSFLTLRRCCSPDLVLSAMRCSSLTQLELLEAGEDVTPCLVAQVCSRLPQLRVLNVAKCFRSRARFQLGGDLLLRDLAVLCPALRELRMPHVPMHGSGLPDGRDLLLLPFSTPDPDPATGREADPVQEPFPRLTTLVVHCALWMKSRFRALGNLRGLRELSITALTPHDFLATCKVGCYDSLSSLSALTALHVTASSSPSTRTADPAAGAAAALAAEAAAAGGGAGGGGVPMGLGGAGLAGGAVGGVLGAAPAGPVLGPTLGPRAMAAPREPHLNFIQNLQHLKVLTLETLTTCGLCFRYIALLPHLTVLALGGCIDFSHEGFRCLQSACMPQLRSLKLLGCQWGSAAPSTSTPRPTASDLLSCLPASTPSLEYLELGSCPGVTAAQLGQLQRGGQLTALRHVRLHQAPMVVEAEVSQAPDAARPNPEPTSLKPAAVAASAAPQAPAPAAKPVEAQAPPAATAANWQSLNYVPDLGVVINGSAVPGYFLVVHDNKKGEAPRLSAVTLHDGQLHTVVIQDKGRGLAAAKDLECLWMIDAATLGKRQPLYFAMTSIGAAWMFKVSTYKGQFVAHAVKPFSLVTPPGQDTKATNCEGARCYLENNQLFLEYGSRGGQYNGQRVVPWVARTPMDVQAVREGRYTIDPHALEVTYWPDTIDGDPLVRQCADMGQGVGMARYGQLFAAAYDDEEHEVNFRSYVMERLPGAQPGGVECFRPLFKVPGGKIEAIIDITQDLSLFATDDEGKGAFLTLFNRHSGLAWKVPVSPPAGADPRLYGVSGIGPVNPSITKEKSESDSEGEEEEEQEQPEEQQREEQPEAPAGRDDDEGMDTPEAPEVPSIFGNGALDMDE